MSSRPPPPGLRRMIFGVLFVFALVIPIALWILVASHRLTDPAGILALVRWWSAATALLLIWSAIHIKEEPGLARTALYFSAVLFALFTLFARTQTGSAITDSGSTQPAETGNGKNIKSGKLQEAILGKWQLDGSKETAMFMKDGAFVIKNAEGQNFWGRSYFLDSNRLQLFFAVSTTDKPLVFNDLAVTGDTMSRTLDGGKKATYHRIKTNAESSVTGTWKTSNGNSFIFAVDGTFLLGVDDGPWERKGKEFVIKSNHSNGSTWRLTLSSDGGTLSGKWSDPAGNSGVTTLIRHPNLKNLAEAIVGKWQLLGHTETCEYSKDGTATLISDNGESLKLNYSVVDASHIQVSTQDQLTFATWTLVTMKEDSLTTSTSEGTKPVTYIRVK